MNRFWMSVKHGNLQVRYNFFQTRRTIVNFLSKFQKINNFNILIRLGSKIIHSLKYIGLFMNHLNDITQFYPECL